jgi:hypothetical protein
MLASHAALWLLTGSLEILVFHTLSAGNIGQFSAPGTAMAVTGTAVTGVVVTGVVVTGVFAMTGVAAVTGVPAVAGAAAVADGAVPGAAVTLLVDAAPHPGADAATTAPATIQRPA